MNLTRLREEKQSIQSERGIWAGFPNFVITVHSSDNTVDDVTSRQRLSRFRKLPFFRMSGNEQGRDTNEVTAVAHNQAMRDERSGTIGGCAYCDREAVVVHLSFPMCGACFAETSIVAYERVGFDGWITSLPKDVAEHVIRAMLAHSRRAS
jgi:hypothetical protein